MEPIITIFLAISAGLAIYSVGVLRRQSRADALEALAGGLGLAYSAGCPPVLHLPALPLFTYGENENNSFNFISAGAWAGAQLYFFDFSYCTRRGRNSENGALTCALAVYEDKLLPGFELQPEKFFNKVEQLIMRQDIDLPEHPRFSRLYQLLSAEPEAAAAFFYKGRAKLLENNPGWYMQAAGCCLLLSRTGSGSNLISSKKYPSYIEQVKNLLTALAVY